MYWYLNLELFKLNFSLKVLSSVNQQAVFIFNWKYFSRRKMYTQGLKGKVIPLQAWTSPEVSRRLRFPDFETTDT